MSDNTMNIPIVGKVLEKNDAAAEQNRARFNEHGLVCVNLLGGAGCGKTALLEAVLPQLKEELRIGVLEGDLTTTRDAERIAALDVPVVQLMTEGGCHLSAPHVQKALAKLPLNDIDLLIIENVGNPICPANFDLGEHARVALLSVTDGDDKPSKYPLLFRDARLVVLSKCDLLPLVRFNLEHVRTDLRRLNAHSTILTVSARNGHGLERFADWFRELAAGPPAATGSSPGGLSIPRRSR